MAYMTDQIPEIRYYCELKKLAGQPMDTREAINTTCMEWISRYAERWRQLKDQGVEDPAPIIRREYSIHEDQYKGPEGNMRRGQSSFPQALGTSVSFGGDGLPRRKRKGKKKTFIQRLNEIFSIHEEQYHHATASYRENLCHFRAAINKVYSGPENTGGGPAKKGGKKRKRRK